MRRALAVMFGVMVVGLPLAAAPAAWRWVLPHGVSPPPVPADNPMSAAKVELGRRLFYDADLSLDGTLACASCHEQRHGFADSISTRAGVHGDPGLRNAPGLANIGWIRPLTWADPALTTLESQVAMPVLGDRPVEMGMKDREALLLGRLAGDDCYAHMFRAAFPETRGLIDMAGIAKALAAFQRTMISFDTPYDRAAAGAADTMSPAAESGAALFNGAAGCATCHAGPHFTDGQFHAIEPVDPRDRGLGDTTGRRGDDGKFRTAGLRNVALGAPYMHDGRSATLPEAIARHRAAIPALSTAQMAELVAFLDALTDRRFVADPKLARPDRACGKRL